MKNQAAAVTRRLSDPDFQGTLVSRCVALTLGAFALLGVSLAHDVYVWSNPPLPLYFRVDGVSTPRRLVALTSPVLSDTQMLEWTVKSVLAPYNVDYYNYPIELNTASRAFTANGWNTFAKSFIAGGNFDEMKRARLLCHAQPTRAALFHDKPYFDRGALVYDVEVPIVETCENVNQTSTSYLLIKAEVVRVNGEQHPDGLAINQMVACDTSGGAACPTL